MPIFCYYLLVISLFHQVVDADYLLSDPHVFAKMFEDFNDLLGHREIYILYEPSRTTNSSITQLCLDIFKSIRRQDYVRTIPIQNRTAILAIQRTYEKLGPVLILSLSGPEVTALAAEHVSFCPAVCIDYYSTEVISHNEWGYKVGITSSFAAKGCAGLLTFGLYHGV